MQALDPTFQAALSSDYAILAYCLDIESPAPLVWRFTSFDVALSIGGKIYQPGCTISPMAAESTEGLNSSSTGIEGIIDSDAAGFSEEVLRSGILNGAIARLYLIDPFYPPISFTQSPAPFIEFPAIKIKGIRRTDTRWQAELADSGVGLNRKIGIETSKYCRAFFGDADCGVNLAPLTTTLTAQAGSTKKILNLSAGYASNFFQYGKVIFTAGKNLGVARGIDTNSGTIITLSESLPFLPEVGSNFQAIKGCAHTKIACISYQNIQNFRGESAIPGTGGYLGGA